MQPTNPSAIGKSKAEPSFLTSAGAKIDRHSLPVREFESRIPQRRLDPLAALFHRIVR